MRGRANSGSRRDGIARYQFSLWHERLEGFLPARDFQFADIEAKLPQDGIGLFPAPDNRERVRFPGFELAACLIMQGPHRLEVVNARMLANPGNDSLGIELRPNAGPLSRKCIREAVRLAELLRFRRRLQSVVVRVGVVSEPGPTPCRLHQCDGGFEAFERARYICRLFAPEILPQGFRDPEKSRARRNQFHSRTHPRCRSSSRAERIGRFWCLATSTGNRKQRPGPARGTDRKRRKAARIGLFRERRCGRRRLPERSGGFPPGRPRRWHRSYRGSWVRSALPPGCLQRDRKHAGRLPSPNTDGHREYRPARCGYPGACQDMGTRPDADGSRDRITRCRARVAAAPGTVPARR